jgi:hypothetical protein
VESAYVAKLKACSEEHVVPVDPSDAEPSAKQDKRTQSAITTAVIAPSAKPVRRRSKAHLAFVASQRALFANRLLATLIISNLRGLEPWVER